ncbi:unnamed protein product [Moneuplotes crassus]|uniref:Thioredoxin domain-containing protein n=1 Tax=Euplotes crassus TaxID=5936 RepID=A0AAD1U7W1_EUPCR|nr:unnamed protein product [Moneuplotes crassus]
MLRKICLLLSILLVLATAEKKDLTEYVSDEGIKCRQDTPAMTIGDEFIGYRENLAHFQEKYEVFILGISDSSCDICCGGEIILEQITELFRNESLLYNNANIPIVRLDVQKHGEMLQGSGIMLDYLPRLFLYFKGKYYLYNEEDNLNLFVHFINRVTSPVVDLTSNEQVERFIDTTKEFVESDSFYKREYRFIKEKFEKIPKVTRVIGLFSDSTKYDDQISNLTKVAEELAERTDLRIGIVTDHQLVALYKKQKGPFWFSENSTNSIVVFREQSDIEKKNRFFSVEDENYDLKSWISFSSLDEVEELNKYTAMILQDIQMPIFLALLPEKWEDDKQSVELMNNLKSCAHHFPQIMYTYTNSSEDYFLRDRLTIVWKDLPAMGLLNNDGMMPVNFPRSQPFSLGNLKSFFGHFINGTIHTPRFTLPDVNTDFSLNMPHASQIDMSGKLPENGIDKLLKEDLDKDRVVLLYNSTTKFYENDKATFLLELSAYLFNDTGVDSVELYYMDINQGELPEELKNNRIIPHFQLLPAKATDKKDFHSELGKNIEDLLLFIRDNAKNDVSKAFDGLGWEDRGKDSQPSQGASSEESTQAYEDDSEKKEDL